MSDFHNLSRFIDAQKHKYESVVEELRDGRKYGHWMWYIFPQIAGLGASFRSQTYAIASLQEATAYYDHVILGSRLRECTKYVSDINDRTTVEIFGHTDHLKFRSSMTLFLCATNDDLFSNALSKYYDSERDPLTLRLLDLS